MKLWENINNEVRRRHAKCCSPQVQHGGLLAVAVMWREKPPLIHTRFSLSVFQDHPGGINYKSNLSWYVNPFDVSLVKLLHILWYWSGKTLSTVTSYTNCKSLRRLSAALFHLTSLQTPNASLLKSLHWCPWCTQFKASGNIQSTNVWCRFAPCMVSVSRLSAWVHSHPPSHALARPCSLCPHPSNPPCGHSQKIMLPSHSRKTCLKQSVPSFLALI